METIRMTQVNGDYFLSEIVTIQIRLRTGLKKTSS